VVANVWVERGLAVFLPRLRLLVDLRAVARSDFCFASASASCAIAAQVLSLISFHIANTSSELAILFPPLQVFIVSNTSVKVR
jgi:hypothetical protein